MRHVENQLTAYLDGALEPARVAEVEGHLGACADCRAVRDRLAAAMRTLAHLPPPPQPSPGFARTFWARLEAEPPRRRFLELLRTRWVAPLAGAAAAAAVVLVVRQGQLRTEREIAAQLDLFENYELVASIGSVETPEDAEVVAHLHELGEERP